VTRISPVWTSDGTTFVVGGVIGGIPVDSLWSGTITGNVAGQAFSLPVDVEIKRALRGESNPVHLASRRRCRLTTPSATRS
jgi:hypothetical protein